MITSLLRSTLAVTALLAFAPALAQEAAPAAAPAEVSAEQVQQIVATLRQRNDQVRALSEQVRELEARAARADGLAAQLANAEQALGVAADKNRALQAIGEEIIVSYEQMTLGKRALTGEPFTQLYRVRMENELQDYRDKVAQLGFYPERDVRPVAAASSAP
ncbi:MAG: hypothetical protein B7Z08_06140 [Sphingomonadales bacterium 32-68-7]|nr:MAG: hypothetical protein B7Z33_10215 [Sphingomonadales bacterium 12-68-11]OYX09222.1 MAG: hypothetical protein B7Z08_06140 [Sphingomonadales bacterium 32-68-7]